MTGHGTLDEYMSPAARRARPGAAGRAVMLDVHLPGGTRTALPYSLLLKVTMEPGKVVAHFVPGRLVVTGAGLEPLYKGLSQHRVRSVAVSVDGRGFSPEGVGPPDAGPVITGLTIEDHGQEKG